MKKKSKKVSLKAVLLLCAALFVTGYVVGALYPLPMFEETGFFGSMRRPPGGGGHRN